MNWRYLFKNGLLSCDKTPGKDFTSHHGFCQHQLLTPSPSAATKYHFYMVRHITIYYSLTGFKKNGDDPKFFHVGDTSSTSELGRPHGEFGECFDSTVNSTFGT